MNVGQINTFVEIMCMQLQVHKISNIIVTDAACQTMFLKCPFGSEGEMRYLV